MKIKFQIEDEMILDEDKYSIWQVTSGAQTDVSDFTFDIFGRKYGREQTWSELERNKFLMNDLDCSDNSIVFAAVDNQERLLATIRLLERKEEGLNVEREFNIDINPYIESMRYKPERVFEVGRFAKSMPAMLDAQMSRMEALDVVDDLLTVAFRHCFRVHGTAVFALVDNQVMELMRCRGICFQAVSESVTCSGQAATPSFLDLHKCAVNMIKNYPRYYDRFFGGVFDAAAAA